MAELTERKSRPFAENKVLKNWIESMGGPARMACKLGIEESTLWRWTVGELETPVWVSKFMELSEINGARRQEIAAKSRENERLKNQIQRQEKEIRELKNELKSKA